MRLHPAISPLLLAAAHSLFVKPIALAAFLIGLASAPAFADAVTYTGTLGGQAIVFELTELKDGPLLGRYSYLSNGADIPLHALSSNENDAVLAEEAPCTPALCERPDDKFLLEPPLGGRFELHYSANNAKLTGTWRASNSTVVELPVDLTRFGQRAYSRDDVFPYGSFLWMNYNYAPITPDTSPYDYAKMQVSLTEGPLQTMGRATYREVTDPRTKFASPRIVSLPGAGDVALVNAMLDQRRWATNFSGFECLSMDYLSGVWMPLPFGTGGASLGGIDQDQISIDYLSDTVMTVRQTGSLACGGGSPYDFTAYYSYDVSAGGALDLSRIFKDWDATTQDPTQPMIDWVVAAYRKASNYNPDRATWCATNETLTEGLDVSFALDDVAVFFIGDMEDASCMGLIVTVHLSEIKDLLTNNASDYFPLLKP